MYKVAIKSGNIAAKVRSLIMKETDFIIVADQALTILPFMSSAANV